MSDPFPPLAQAAIDAIHASLGVTASYVSDARSATVLVIPKRPDALIDGFSGRPAKAETALFEVRTSEVPTPAPDDIITIGFDTWRVRSVRVPDRRRLTVLLDCVPVLVTADAHAWPDGDRAVWPDGDGWAWA